jgi:hypothetical protein
VRYSSTGERGGLRGSSRGLTEGLAVKVQARDRPESIGGEQRQLTGALLFSHQHMRASSL